MAKEIELRPGFTVIIDDADYERVSKFRWNLHKTPKNYYAYRNERNGSWRRRQLIHHFLLGTETSDTLIDHVNGNGLDNRRENLRICSKKENCRNTPKRCNNTSGYKGVGKCGKKWRAMIGVDGKRTHLGVFENIIDAVKAYNDAAIKYHGEFARLNEI